MTQNEKLAVASGAGALLGLLLALAVWRYVNRESKDALIAAGIDAANREPDPARKAAIEQAAADYSEISIAEKIGALAAGAGVGVPTGILLSKAGLGMSAPAIGILAGAGVAFGLIWYLQRKQGQKLQLLIGTTSVGSTDTDVRRQSRYAGNARTIRAALGLAEDASRERREYVTYPALRADNPVRQVRAGRPVVALAPAATVRTAAPAPMQLESQPVELYQGNQPTQVRRDGPWTYLVRVTK
jgi:hypothetical protein